MKGTKIVLTLAVLLIVVGGGLAVLKRGTSNAPVSTVNTAGIEPVAVSTSTPVVPSPPSVATPSGYTLAQVSTHDAPASCWVTIGGQVYDLTAWINQHPGGPEKIIGLCGRDGTQAFLGQHAGQARPEQALAKFLIGKLIN